jgi:hypothetical protein
MKALNAFYIVLLLAVLPEVVYCQPANDSDTGRMEISYFHVQAYIGGIRGLEYGGAGKLYFSNGIILGVDYNSAHFISKKLPDDYAPGPAIFALQNPIDNITSYSVTFGMYISSDDALARLAIEASPGFKNYDETNFIPHPGTRGQGTIYEVYKVHHTTGGLLTEARVEINLSNYLGIGVGAGVNASAYQILPTLKICLLAGNLRNKIRYIR